MKQLQRLVEAFAAGDLDTCARLTSTRWPEPEERPTEDSPQAHWETIGAAVRAALTDWELELSELTEEDGVVTGTLRGSAAFTGNLWGYPGDGKRVSVEATVVARADGDRVQWAFHDFTPMPVLQALRLVPPPEYMDRPLAYPVSMPTELLKFAFNGGFFEKPCAHLDQIAVTEPERAVCQLCEDEGTEYPAVRMCLICGYVGCCDTSTNKHARQHYEETGHVLMRSVRLSESWVWCYEDETVMAAKW